MIQPHSDASESLDEIRERRLQATMAAVAAAHPFYRERIPQRLLTSVRTLEDLQLLPLTTKNDYIADPESFRLRPDDLPASASMEERVLWDVAFTTGTTSGRPSPFYNTTHDCYGILDQARRCNEAEGLRADDRVANLYPLAGFPTGAFRSVVRSTMIAGLPVVHGLTGAANSEFKVRNALSEAIEKVQRLRPTVLWGVPSFVRRFLHDAQSRAADFSAVRMVITSGEPVPPPLRAEIRERLGAMGAGQVELRARYAFTEMQGGLVQCAEAAAVQNVVPDLYYLEVVEPESGRRLPDGENGHLAITHLHRRGTVMLRYLVGDVVTLSREPCPLCGRSGERVIVTPRRTGNLVKCRGMLVNTDLVLSAVASIEELTESQLVFTRDQTPGAMDRLVVRVEWEPGTDRSGWTEDALRAEITQRVRTAVSLRPEIEFVARGGLYDHEQSIKTKRVIDLRHNSE
jgi:phenylacetate-CoA ligase